MSKKSKGKVAYCLSPPSRDESGRLFIEAIEGLITSFEGAAGIVKIPVKEIKFVVDESSKGFKRYKVSMIGRGVSEITSSSGYIHEGGGLTDFVKLEDKREIIQRVYLET
jgi:hypothetical protein